jgi:cation diffusion facilitator family transporter
MAGAVSSYEPLSGDLHRHGALTHDHPHTGLHRHRSRGHPPPHGHGHSHGLIDPSIRRSRLGLRAVGILLAVLAAASLAQVAIFVVTDSVALLADVIHNFGDALTAVPVGVAFLLGSERAERIAGMFVVAAIFISACVAGYEAILRLIEPRAPSNLGALAAGAIGYAGNWIAAQIRLRAGRTLASAALVADGHHARADAYVSLAVVASAAVVALGLDLADPLIGLTITGVILGITWQSWRTIRDQAPHGRRGSDA